MLHLPVTALARPPLRRLRASTATLAALAVLAVPAAHGSGEAKVTAHMTQGGSDATLAAQAAHANGEATVAAQVARLRGQLDRAVLVVGARGIAFNSRMIVSELPLYGCTYTLRDGAALAALADLLEAGQFAQVPEHGRALDIRLGIYLYMHDGTRADILFQPAFIGQGMRGYYQGRANIVSGINFEPALRGFALHHDPSQSNRYCSDDRRIPVGAPEVPAE